MSDSDLDAELTAAEGETPPEDPPQGEVESEPAPVEGETPEPMVPVSVLTAEREENRKRLEIAESVARINIRPPVEQPKPELPDFMADDSEKIAGFIDQRIRLGQQEISKEFAVDAYGQEAVDKAHAALEAHGTPTEQQALSASANPWGRVVKWHQNREAMAEIGGDPAAFVARIKKEALAQATVSKAKGLDPAPTLAGEPNLGARETTVEPEDKESLKALLGS